MKRSDIIKNILELEWDMFTSATNAEGRASCQDDKPTFLIMRKAQADVWSTQTLLNYMSDLENAKEIGLNLMAIKYAHMMKITFPDEFALIKNNLPTISDKVAQLADEITKYHSKWTAYAAKKYPKLISMCRPVTVEDANEDRYASMDNYLHSELLTYSEGTLLGCLKDTITAEEEGINLSLVILKKTAECYGFDSLDAIEAAISRRS